MRDVQSGDRERQQREELHGLAGRTLVVRDRQPMVRG
jgi:hypothetical protein